jgi:hypothetical protein
VTLSVVKSSRLVPVVVKAAPDSVVAVLGPAVERPFRRIADVPNNLLELNSGDDAAGKFGAVHT